MRNDLVRQALSKRLSLEQVGRVTPYCSCNRSSISRLAKSLKSPLSSVKRKGRSLDKMPIVLVWSRERGGVE